MVLGCSWWFLEVLDGSWLFFVILGCSCCSRWFFGILGNSRKFLVLISVSWWFLVVLGVFHGS